MHAASLFESSEPHPLFGTYVLLTWQQHDNTENLTGQSKKKNETWLTHADTVTGLSIVCAFCEILVQTSVGDAVGLCGRLLELNPGSDGGSFNMFQHVSTCHHMSCH